MTKRPERAQPRTTPVRPSVRAEPDQHAFADWAARRVPPDSGSVLVAPVRALPQVLREFGCEPAEVIPGAGVPMALFDGEHHHITFRQLGRLFQHCAVATGCDHFHLLVGERFDLAALGDTAQRMAVSGTVEAALRAMILAHHLVDAAAVPMLLPASRSRVLFAYSAYTPDVPGLAAIVAGSLAIGMRIMQGLCGSSWQPLRVALAQRPPPDIGPYRRIFGPNLVFNAELPGILFAAEWLRQPVASTFREAVAQYPPAATDAAGRSSLPLAVLVRRALPPLIFAGNAAQPAVARGFGLHPRALTRRLAAEGVSFRSLLNGARVEIAQQLLAETDLPVTQIAAVLHYADSSAFVRAFRASTGSAPHAWRLQFRHAAHQDLALK